jgi:3'-5' exoribonuclease
MDDMKKTFIKDIKAGDFVDDVFVLSEKSLSQKKDGKNYLNLTLADKTGTLKGVMWDRVDELPEGLSSGNVVGIKGNVSEYRGNLQLVVKSMTPMDPEGLDPADYLPVSPRDMDQMFSRLLQISGTLQSEPLKGLLDAFWTDQGFVKHFKTAPAAKRMHHPYVGGLLEHTLSITLLADKVAAHYSGVDRDLLITGAILHDIGKTRELTTGLSIDYSDEGRLLSHIVIGVLMLREKINTLNHFPEDLAVLLEHMVISHHGTREFGSPEPPKTIEAVLLNYVDEIDARVKSIREFMDSEDPSESWTSYHRTLERHFFMKNHRKTPEGPSAK